MCEESRAPALPRSVGLGQFPGSATAAEMRLSSVACFVWIKMASSVTVTVFSRGLG